MLDKRYEVKDLAQRYNVKPGAIYARIKNGALPPFCTRRPYYILEGELAKWEGKGYTKKERQVLGF